MDVSAKHRKDTRYGLHTASLIPHVLCCTLSVAMVTAQTTHDVRLGTDASFTCTKPSGASMVWDRQGRLSTGAIAVNGMIQQRPDKYRLSAVDKQGQRTEELTVRAVALDDEDVYRCSTMYNQDYVTFTLSVLVPPRAVILVAPPAAMNEGGSTSLTCAISYSKPAAKVAWHVRDPNGNTQEVTTAALESRTNAANGTTRVVSVLGVDRVTRDMYGATYFCHASIDRLNYHVFLNATLDINLRPLAPYISGISGAVLDGAEIRVVCHADGARPAATVLWYWHGSQVNGRRSVVQTSTGLYNVVNALQFKVTKSHQGAVLVCRVTNQVTEDLGEAAITRSVTISVYHKPVVRVEASPMVRFQQTSATLTCTYQALPVPGMVTWLQNGVVLAESHRKNMTSTSTKSALEITHLAYDDKGKYQCLVMNIVGSTLSDPVYLNVLHSPVCVYSQKTKYGAAIGQTIEVTCNVEANPRSYMTFQWNTDGRWRSEQWQEASGHQHYAFSKISYKIWSERDYKSISCRALNGIPSSSPPCVFQILKPGPAEAPTDCREASLRHDSVDIQCREEYDGGSQPAYSLQMLSGGSFKEVASAATPSFSLQGALEADTKYYYRVCVRNAEHSKLNCTLIYDFKTTVFNGSAPVQQPVTGAQVATIVGASVGCLVFVVLLALLLGLAYTTRRKIIRERQTISRAADAPSISAWCGADTKSNTFTYGTATPYVGQHTTSSSDNDAFSEDTDFRYLAADDRGHLSADDTGHYQTTSGSAPSETPGSSTVTDPSYQSITASSEKKQPEYAQVRKPKRHVPEYENCSAPREEDTGNTRQSSIPSFPLSDL